MKSWQVVTHPATSSTWRRAGITISKSKQARYGFLRPTRENLGAWEKTLEVAKTVDAAVIIVQTSPSFVYTEQNAKNAERFLSEASWNVAQPSGGGSPPV